MSVDEASVSECAVCEVAVVQGLALGCEELSVAAGVGASAAWAEVGKDVSGSMGAQHLCDEGIHSNDIIEDNKWT